MTDDNKKAVTPGIGAEGCKLPSPSRVNTMPVPLQVLVVFGISVMLYFGTSVLSNLLDSGTNRYKWFQYWRYTWPLMGLLYAFVGVTHFTKKEDTCNIYPSRGTWGFWYLPGGAKLHVYWTGVVEIVFGLGLVVGGMIEFFSVSNDDDGSYKPPPPFISSAGLRSDCAAILFVMTIAVTPANIYMYTHGARMPLSNPSYPLQIHIIRGLVQIMFLAFLYQMSSATFQALL